MHKSAPQLEWGVMRRVPFEVWLGAAVAAFGFGALLSFHFLYGWTVRPGLFHYRSATFGDGIFLPLAVGLLLRLARALDGGRSDWLCAGGAAFVGGAAGTIVTLRALADPNPALNWTMPAPGVLNAPGWYHAIFLSLYSALIAGLLGLVLIRLSRLGRRSRDAV